MGPGDSESIVARVCVWVDKHNRHNVWGGREGYTGSSGSREEEMIVAQQVQEGIPGGNHVCAGFLNNKWEEAAR